METREQELSFGTKINGIFCFIVGYKLYKILKFWPRFYLPPLYINGIHSFSLTLDILKHSTRYSTWQKATFIPLIFPRFNKGEARSFHPKIHHENIFTLSTRFFTWGKCIVKLKIKIIVLRKSQIKIINEQYIFFYFESHLSKIEFN